MTSLVALFAYAGFLVCAGALALASGRATDRLRRRRTSVFIGYVLLVSLTAGVSQRDLWPFSAWRLMVGDAPSRIGDPPSPRSIRIHAVDAQGEEHAVDYRAWQPLSVEELSAWLLLGFPELSGVDRAEVGAFLLDKAETGRSRARLGEIPGTFDRVFGRLSAPYHLLHPRIWARSGDVPAAPFVGIRLYREYYDIETYRRSGAIRLEMSYEYAR